MKPMILALMISNFIFTGIAYSATAAESYRINPNMKSRAAVASQKSYKSISPADARKRMNSGESVVLLDVRTPEEFAVKHIPGSILIPVEPVDLVTTDVEAVIVDKNIPVFIYCRSGRRSVDAAKIMVKAGYTDVYDLGGINSWPYETASANTDISSR